MTPGWGLRVLQASLVLISVAVVFGLTPPEGFWSWLPLVAFLYMRSIETLPHLVLRWLVPLSPLAWIAIAYHAQAYALLPADVLSFGSALYWLWRHYRPRAERA